MRLGDFIQLRRDLTQPSSDGNARYVGLEHIDSGNVRLSRWGTESEVKSSKNKFFAGDILYGKLRPYLDKVVLAEWEGMCATDILVFVANRRRVLPEFIAYLLHTRAFLNHAISTTSGTNHPRTSWQALQAFAFALPPLPEQRAIARVLATIQRAVEAQDQLIAATRAFKRALMRHLFTYGAVPPADAARVPLKDTEIGAVPVGWEVVRLGKIADMGGSKRGMPTLQHIPFIPMSLIPEQGLFITRWDMREPEEIRSGVVVQNGDFLLAKITPCLENGKQGIVQDLPDGWGYATTEVITIRPHQENLLTEFLAFYLLSPVVRADLASKLEGTTGRQRLPKSVVQNLLISLPPLPEQRAIARILAAVDTKIAAEEKRKAALQTLFKTMLHQLMTGQIQVITD